MIVCPFADLKRYTSIIPGLEEALEAVAELTDWTPRTIPLSGGNRIMVQQATTRSVAEGKIEAHRNYLDIQYIAEGEETMGWAPLSTLTPADSFNTEKDVGFYTGSVDFIRIGAGNCYVVFPEDAHMPGVYLDQPCNIRKLVLKLKV